MSEIIAALIGASLGFFGGMRLAKYQDRRMARRDLHDMIPDFVAKNYMNDRQGLYQKMEWTARLCSRKDRRMLAKVGEALTPARQAAAGRVREEQQRTKQALDSAAQDLAEYLARKLR